MFNAYAIIQCPTSKKTYRALFSKEESIALIPDADPEVIYKAEIMKETISDALFFDQLPEDITYNHPNIKPSSDEDVIHDLINRLEHIQSELKNKDGSESNTYKDKIKHLVKSVENYTGVTCFLSKHQEFVILEKGNCPKYTKV